MSNHSNVFGKTIQVKSYLHRSAKTIQGKTIKQWSHCELTRPKTVLVIGVRTLQNGGVTYEEEVGAIFSRDTKQDFKALLVVEKPTRKPFYVPFDTYISLFETKPPTLL